jgi:hypothetical protein
MSPTPPDPRHRDVGPMNAWVSVDEVRAISHATGAAAEWWRTYRLCAEAAGRAVLHDREVRVMCTDWNHAAWLKQRIVEHGLIEASVTVGAPT